MSIRIHAAALALSSISVYAEPVRVILDMDANTPGIQTSITVEPGTTLVRGVAVYIYDPEGGHSVRAIGYIGGLDRGIAIGHVRPNASIGSVTGIVGHSGTPIIDGGSHYLSGGVEKAFNGPELQYLASGTPTPIPMTATAPVFTIDVQLTDTRAGESFNFYLADMVSIWRLSLGAGAAGAFCTREAYSFDSGGDCVPDGTPTIHGVDLDAPVPVPPAAFQVDYIDGPGVIHIATCGPNCDHSTSPPVLNANDFQCFLNKYAAADTYANCDGSTQPPILNANDFQCFLNQFAAGCP